MMLYSSCLGSHGEKHALFLHVVHSEVHLTRVDIMEQ